MEQESLLKAKAWASNTFFKDSEREEIQKLIDTNNTKEIIDRFYKDMEFGTGGIRGIMGQGLNRMNKYTIMRATQALATEINSLKLKEAKVAVSYDSRNNSFEFAKITAQVLAANNIHVYIYKRLNPVCLLSFSVRYHNAVAGVMVTASHNPPEYNGYKVYWDDGAQVTPPYDNNIIGHYNRLTDFSKIPIMTLEDAESKGLIHWVGEEIENAYLNMIYEKSINPKMCQENGTKIKIVYTPIHGAGLIPCTKALTRLGITNFEVVKEQEAPNGLFPTVTSPNPENASALKLAVDLMKKNSADIVFGTDPDCDRIGIAVNHKDEIHYLSGNQIGSLLLYYIAKNLKESQRMPKNPYCIKTIVTTELQTKIAKHFGVTIENTLTGFKWICGKMRDIEQNEPTRNYIFGTEESFGYLSHNQVRDKDGVAPLTVLAEMALYYKLQNKTLIDALDEIYSELGFHYEDLLNLNYYGVEGSQKISRIMDKFRNKKDKNFAGETIIEIEDYQMQQITNLKLGQTRKTIQPKSNVLGYLLESGDKVMLRPSGTEPKIKFYLLLQENSGTLDQMKQKAKQKAERILQFLKSESESA